MERNDVYTMQYLKFICLFNFLNFFVDFLLPRKISNATFLVVLLISVESETSQENKNINIQPIFKYFILPTLSGYFI